VREHLRQHPETAKEIETALRAKLLTPKKGEAPASEAASEA